MHINYVDYLLIKAGLTAIFNSFTTFTLQSLQDTTMSEHIASDVLSLKKKGDEMILSFEATIDLSNDFEINVEARLRRSGIVELIIIPDGDEAPVNSSIFLKEILKIEKSTADIVLRSKNKNKIYRCLLTVLSVIKNDWTERKETIHHDVEFLTNEIKISEIKYNQKMTDHLKQG